MFAALVPLLLGFATVLFAFAGRISAWLSARAARRRGDAAPFARRAAAGLGLWRLFRRRLGVLMLGVLSVGTGGDYRSANATKNLVSSLNSFTAAIIFAVQGVVAWPATLAMMAGTLVGALIGARLAQVMPSQAARGVVVVRRRAAHRCDASPWRLLALRPCLAPRVAATTLSLRQLASRFTMSLSGSVSASITVKWLVPAISS